MAPQEPQGIPYTWFMVDPLLKSNPMISFSLNKGKAVGHGQCLRLGADSAFLTFLLPLAAAVWQKQTNQSVCIPILLLPT